MLRRLIRGYYSLRYLPRRLFAALNHLSLQLAALQQGSQQSSMTLADIEVGIGAFCDDATRAMLGLDRSVAAASGRMSQVHRALMRADVAGHDSGAAVAEMRRAIDEVRAQTASLQATLNHVAEAVLPGGGGLEDGHQLGTPVETGSLNSLLRLMASVGRSDDAGRHAGVGAPDEAQERFDNVNAAVSIGIANSLSWDLSVAGRGIPVFQFDQSVAAPSVSNPLFTFERVALAGAGVSDGTTLEAIVRTRLASMPGPLILKLDMELCDWDVIAAADELTLKRFRSVVLQFRKLERFDDASFRALAANVLGKLVKTHVFGHARADGCVDLMDDCGALIASSAEVHLRLRETLPAGAKVPASTRTITYSRALGQRDRHEGAAHRHTSVDFQGAAASQ